MVNTYKKNGLHNFTMDITALKDMSPIRGLQAGDTLRTWSVWSAQCQYTVIGWDDWSVPILASNKAGNIKHWLSRWNILFTLKIKFQIEHESYIVLCMCYIARLTSTSDMIFVFYSTSIVSIWNKGESETGREDEGGGRGAKYPPPQFPDILTFYFFFMKLFCIEYMHTE